MTNPGSYDRKFLRLKYSQVNGTMGQWEPAEVYWGCVSQNKKLREDSENGMLVRVSQVEIKLRNYVEIDAKDRLQDSWFGTVYALEGVHFGDNEMIVEAHSHV